MPAVPCVFEALMCQSGQLSLTATVLIRQTQLSHFATFIYHPGSSQITSFSTNQFLFFGDISVHCRFASLSGHHGCLTGPISVWQYSIFLVEKSWKPLGNLFFDLCFRGNYFCFLEYFFPIFLTNVFLFFRVFFPWIIDILLNLARTSNLQATVHLWCHLPRTNILHLKPNTIPGR